jgi:hypothetical protein
MGMRQLRFGGMLSMSLAGMSLSFLQGLAAVVPTPQPRAPRFNARSNARHTRPRRPGTSQRKFEGFDLRPMAEAKRQRKRAKRLRDRCA